MEKYIVEFTKEQLCFIRSFVYSNKCVITDNEQFNRDIEILDKLDNAYKLCDSRSMIEWHKVTGDEETGYRDIPVGGDTVLVRLKSGEYLTDEVCSDVMNMDDSDETVIYWLDRTNDWSLVDAWAYLPEGGEG